MRIQGGSQRGKAIGRNVAKRTRPTTARVKKAIFDTLYQKFDLDDAKVLDLFAGTGALGFEAASRGATSVVFVDIDDAACSFIRDASSRLGGLEDCKIRVITRDAMAYLRFPYQDSDICFCDPPYEFEAWQDLLELHPATFVVAESNREITGAGGYRQTTLKVYGDTYVSFLQLDT